MPVVEQSHLPYSTILSFSLNLNIHLSQLSKFPVRKAEPSLDAKDKGLVNLYLVQCERQYDAVIVNSNAKRADPQNMMY